MNRKRIVATAVAVFAFSTMLTSAQMQLPASSKAGESSAAPKVLTGLVSDSMCGAQHMEKGKSSAECTQECVKGGTKYALVVGKKVYTLEGHEADLAKVAGMKATVKGKVSGETPGGKLALMNGQTLTKAFVPLPAGAQAVYTSSGLAYYRHGDWLGSSRLSTTPARAKYYDVAYAPFGEPYAGSGTQDLSFTGQNQDTEASVSGGAGGLYDFLYREHTPVQGRWLSPDPAGRGAVDPSNPQTWNRYADVTNNPLSYTDHLGLNRDAVGGCNTDEYNCYGGAGTGAFGSGVGFGGGTDANGFSWNLAPGSFGGPGNPDALPRGAGALQAGVSRYLSIINTGWDPALGINWNNVNYVAQANGQYNRLSGNLAPFGNVSADPTNCYLIGGHCNFALNCDPNAGCPAAGRYDNGVHIECASGGYDCGAFDPHVAHDDTVSPWIGNFSLSALFTGNFWEHGFVDLIGGTFFVGAFPQ